MNKPLIRWTIGGNISNKSILCLKLSIKYIKNIYKNNVDYLICYNNLTENNIKKLPKNIDKISVDNYNNLYKIVMPKNTTGWKLCPPRIRLDSHEVILDNDVIIYKDLFKQFFISNKIYITEGLGAKSPNLKKFINKNFNINSGVICLPPGFDFLNEVKNIINTYKINFTNHFDEQSIIAMVVFNKDYKIISKEDVCICDKFLKIGNYGMHFVRLNNGNNKPFNKFVKTIFI